MGKNKDREWFNSLRMWDKVRVEGVSAEFYFMETRNEGLSADLLPVSSQYRMRVFWEAVKPVELAPQGVESVPVEPEYPAEVKAVKRQAAYLKKGDVIVTLDGEHHEIKHISRTNAVYIVTGGPNFVVDYYEEFTVLEEVSADKPTVTVTAEDLAEVKRDIAEIRKILGAVKTVRVKASTLRAGDRFVLRDEQHTAKSIVQDPHSTVVFTVKGMRLGFSKESEVELVEEPVNERATVEARGLRVGSQVRYLGTVRWVDSITDRHAQYVTLNLSGVSVTVPFWQRFEVVG